MKTGAGLRESILYQAGRPGGRTVDEIMENCWCPKEEVTGMLRSLADEGKIILEYNKVFLA